MLSSFTYDQLVAAMQSWPEDTASEYLADIPRLIDMGQTRLVRELNLEIFDVTNSLLTCNAGSRLVTKPDDWISTRSLGLLTAGNYTPLLQRSRDWCTNYAPNAAAIGTPKYYYEASELQWAIIPTPSIGAGIQADGVGRPAGLSPSNPTNWLSVRVGDVLFCACLMEAEHWFKADDRYADLQGKYYKELLPTARLELRNMIRAGDSYAPYKESAKKAG